MTDMITHVEIPPLRHVLASPAEEAEAEWGMKAYDPWSASLAKHLSSGFRERP